MKKSMSVFSLFAAGAMIVGGAGVSHADDLKVSGFGAIDFYISNEAADAADKQCSNTAGTATTTNCKELQFNVPYAEVDFEKTMGSVTVRLDLDFNGTGNNVAGDDVEQMKFDWALPIGQEVGLNLTAGIFNSPVGFEAQDSPDKLQVTNGQLFNMVPSNIVGLQLSAGTEMVSGSLMFLNDWRDPVPFATNAPQGNAVGEENTLGATLAITPMPEVGLSIGYLGSGIKRANVAPFGPVGEDVLDIVLSGTFTPMPDHSLLYALEYVKDELDTGMGITLNAMHGKHGLTVRYDMVDCDDLSNANNCNTTSASGQEPTTLTVALLCSLEENLKIKLEWKDTDLDMAGPNTSTDATTLQFVALF